MKQYILSIFLVSAAFSLHGMDEETETASDSLVNLNHIPEKGIINAESIIASFDGTTLYHTTVTKNLATGAFEVKAGFAVSTGREVLFMPRSPDWKWVALLEVKINEYQKLVK